MRTKMQVIIKNWQPLATATSPATLNSICNAMDEYAKEIAIAFAEWCNKNSSRYEVEEDLWHYTHHPGHKYSTEIMFSQFIQSITAT